MTQDNYAIKYDGIPCSLNSNCTVNNNSNGLINLTLSLGSEHQLDIDTDFSYLSNYLAAQYKFDSNNGTTAYDSSVNANHGIIYGAAWKNDGVLLTLVNGVDYTLDTISGLLTVSSNYLYSWIMTNWNYNGPVVIPGTGGGGSVIVGGTLYDPNATNISDGTNGSVSGTATNQTVSDGPVGCSLKSFSALKECIKGLSPTKKATGLITVILVLVLIVFLARPRKKKGYQKN